MPIYVYELVQQSEFECIQSEGGGNELQKQLHQQQCKLASGVCSGSLNYREPAKRSLDNNFYLSDLDRNW